MSKPTNRNQSKISSSLAIENVEVISLSETGEGLVLVDHDVIAIPDVLPGERVALHRKDRKSPWVGQVEEPSPHRTEPPCSVFAECGGCAWQHADSKLQQESRLARLRKVLSPPLRAVPVQYVPSPSSWNYRCRARMVWKRQRDTVQLGFRARSSHQVIDAPGCMVLVKPLSDALIPLRDALRSLSNTGTLHLAIGEEGRPVVVLRPEGTLDAKSYALGETLVKQGFAGVALYTEGTAAPVLHGNPRPMLTAVDGLPLLLAMEGFSQANEALNNTLVRDVCSLAKADGARVLELYAGAGNFTVQLARIAKKISAVESDRDAVTALRKNLEHRGITNVSAREDDAIEAVEKAPTSFGGTRKRNPSYDVVVLDPPRTGAKEVCERLATFPPERVVYVSCDPASLSRDLDTLTKAGVFSLRTLSAYEMFPQTAHLEVVAVLERA